MLEGGLETAWGVHAAGAGRPGAAVGGRVLASQPPPLRMALTCHWHCRPPADQQGELAEAAETEAESCRATAAAAVAAKAEALGRVAALEREVEHARQAAHSVEVAAQDERARWGWPAGHRLVWGCTPEWCVGPASRCSGWAVACCDGWAVLCCDGWAAPTPDPDSDAVHGQRSLLFWCGAGP